MYTLVFDDTGSFIGYHQGGDNPHIAGRKIVVDSLPADLPLLLMSADGTLSNDIALLLARAKTRQISKIKQQAADLISGLDWKLTRAKEQAEAGLASSAAVNQVLADRESIRQSSNQAEIRLNALTDMAQIKNFSWTVDQIIPVPKIEASNEFLDRFTLTEQEAVLNTTASNTKLRLWFERLQLTPTINRDRTNVINGVNDLESAGLLAPGRSIEILS